MSAGTTMQQPPVDSDSSSHEVKVLEEKVALLEKQLAAKQGELEESQDAIKSIENNLTRQYVEDWDVTDADGKKGNFCGGIYWMKGDGSLYYKDKSHFEGQWDSMGEIIEGKLHDCHGEVIAEWENGEEIIEEEETEDDDSDDDDDSEDEDPDNKKRKPSV